jgi:hypothetical protein
MASSFRRDASVLHFGPRLPKGMRWSQRRFVLWPALMYRVVAPEVRERQVNVIQKAVLGMCRAGTTNAQRIGDRLRIHPDLAALVYVELQERGLLGRDGLPTQKGRELFEEETLESHKLVTGHVFQDPWNGDLWPRFVERLDYVELQPNPNGFPDLVLGSKGKPRRERAFMCLPGETVCPPVPHPSDVLRATRRHRAALRGADSFEAVDGDEFRSPGGDVPIERVSLVDDHPTPVFLTTFLYLPEAGDVAGEWHVCDPFALGASPGLRRALSREMQSSASLRGLLESMIGRSLDDQIDEQRRWAAEVRAQATLNVESILTVNARTLPQYRDLVDLESAHVEATLLGDACSQQKLRDLLGAARRVLEATFRTIADQHPPRDVWRRVYAQGKPVEDRDYFARVYETSAQTAGFRVPLPAALAAVRPNQVKAACYRDGWRLRGAIVAAILTARDNPSHPLRGAAALDPDLLMHLDAVATAAGEAVHAGDTAVTLDLVQPLIASVHKAVGLLSGLGMSQPIVSART